MPQAGHRHSVQRRSPGRKGAARQYRRLLQIPLRASRRELHSYRVLQILKIGAPRPSGRGSVGALSGVASPLIGADLMTKS
jgi:hypothetical protein